MWIFLVAALSGAIVVVLVITRPASRAELKPGPPTMVKVTRVMQEDVQLLSVKTGRQQPTRRAWPLLLTTAITFPGVSPLIFLATGQTRFLAPMAVSLVFARVSRLLALPCFYLIADDFREWLYNLFRMESLSHEKQ